jgi:hypothetical protein
MPILKVLCRLSTHLNLEAAWLLGQFLQRPDKTVYAPDTFQRQFLDLHI